MIFLTVQFSNNSKNYLPQNQPDHYNQVDENLQDWQYDIAWREV